MLSRDNPPVFDPAALDRLRIPVGAGQVPLVVTTLRLFIETTPKLANDVIRGLRDGDVDTTRLAAHTLKSNSAIVGAEALAALARDIELKARDGKLESAVASRFEKLYAESVAKLVGALADESRKAGIG
ncbi:Hpt domain-containing protein [Derxia gummosa]|uniref:Hpt domain-containing protein n=1 Tax=Derxia gummosa DSM 723 TaxID=1121388 RepID=A0A8B6X4V5_9BURK|nr:Hpt domain-containing protein [Derxia gummosa]